MTEKRCEGARGSDDEVLLYWLPLGAGGHSIRWNGRVFEALVARREGRPVQDLYHSALEVRADGERFVIEQGPAWGFGDKERGVVAGGAVGLRWLGRRGSLFRYEVRRWPDGVIADVAEAVAGPQLVGGVAGSAAELLRLVPQVPTATWGRDELATGEMWNSNSIIAWLLARSGHHMGGIQPPSHGRAPGWAAGLVVAARVDATGGRPPAPADASHVAAPLGTPSAAQPSDGAAVSIR